ncbi:MAG: hypothetical protein LBV69_07230 [Bacteroidales bacterium]|jgi:hypothetical protein|nr:hypothetical protein [Bacteroidales bacterium]
MKDNRYLTILVLLLISSCSQNYQQYDKEKCEQMFIETSKKYEDYYFSHSTNYQKLDSSLLLIDTMLCRCKYNYINITISKLMILSEKKDYKTAIKFIKSLDNDFPIYWQSIYLKRFEAMQAQEIHYISKKNKLIKKIILDIEEYLTLSSNSNIVDSVLKLQNIEDIKKFDKHVAIIQYYYYRCQLEGNSVINYELDSLQKTKNWNKEFIDTFIKVWLKQDFMEFLGT